MVEYMEVDNKQRSEERRPPKLKKKMVRVLSCFQESEAL
jgi:hypothetical protein